MIVMHRSPIAALAAVVALLFVMPARADEVWLADLASARGFVIEGARLVEARDGTRVTVKGASTIGALEAVASGRNLIVATARAANPGVPAELDLRFTPIAWDAIAVVAHPANPVKNLTLEQLRDLATGTIDSWAAFGGKAGPINLYAVAGPNDGVEWSTRRLLFGRGTAQVASERWYLNTQQLEDAIALDPNGIGFTLLSNIHGNAKVRALSIDGKAPALATLLDQSYPLPTPIYLVTQASGAALARTQSIKDFVRGDAKMRELMRKKQMLPYVDGKALTDGTAAREQRLAARLGFSFVEAGSRVPQPPAPGKAALQNALTGALADTREIAAIEPGDKGTANALADKLPAAAALPCRPAEICSVAAPAGVQTAAPR